MSETTAQKLSNRRPIILLAVIAALISIGIYFMNSSGTVLKTMPDGLKKSPEFSLSQSSGKFFGSKDFNDHVVIVHFWASWCAPCIPEIPEILSAAKKLPKDNDGRAIYWVLVSQDQSWDKAQSILKPEMLTENVISVIDPEAKISDSYGTYQFPETYLLNRDGGIAAKWIGSQQWSGDWGAKVSQGIENLSRLKKLPES